MGTINIKLLNKRFEESGLKYNELAEDANVCRKTVHNLMNGKTNPSRFVVQSIAIALNLSDEDFFRIFFPKRMQS